MRCPRAAKKYVMLSIEEIGYKEHLVVFKRHSEQAQQRAVMADLYMQDKLPLAGNLPISQALS